MCISEQPTRRNVRTSKGQAMTEFIFMSFVAFVILFVAIQLAALGREYMALGQLNYQVKPCESFRSAFHSCGTATG
jgi:hypothetical protein